jgi:uncharacterized protein
MKATLFLTMACNLHCDYCYIEKQPASMSRETLARALDFAFANVEENERLDFGLFGGEPLLNWPLAQTAVEMVEQCVGKRMGAVRMSLVTNGTLLNEDILKYMREHRMILQVSCDGTPDIQDIHRCYPDGRKSSGIVEANLRTALDILPAVIVNVVYGPDTCAFLPESIKYLASLGLRQIVLNADYSARWTTEDIVTLKKAYQRVVEIYLAGYKKKSPLFISLIDEKIAVILRGGYGPDERCQMGYREFAFSPKGFIFPCERLVADGNENRHCIGHLDRPDLLRRNYCHADGIKCINIECRLCSVADYCMNWCGCTNFFASGDYSRASHFICTSEKLSIDAAFKVLNQTEGDSQMAFINHYAGLPMVNSS